MLLLLLLDAKAVREAKKYDKNAPVSQMMTLEKRLYVKRKSPNIFPLSPLFDES